MTDEPIYAYYPGKGWLVEMPVIGQTCGRAKFKIEFREPLENELFAYDWTEHDVGWWVNWLKDQKVSWIEKNVSNAVDYYKTINPRLTPYFVTFVRWK